MTQRSAILQKKLHEIESELSDIFRLSPEKTTPAADHIYFDDVEQRIEFLKNLYSAEVSSQPPQNTTDEELLETGQRLAAVEASFREWNASRTHMDDALSVCSDCTQSLLHDEGREPEKLLMVKEEEVEEEMQENLSTENVVKKEREEAAAGGGGRRIWGRIGRYFGVFGGGILFGAICVGNCEKLFSDFFAQYDEVFVDLPPT